MRVKSVDLMPTYSGLWNNFSHWAFDQAVDWVIEQTKVEMSRAGQEEFEEENMAGACSNAKHLAKISELHVSQQKTSLFQKLLLLIQLPM